VSGHATAIRATSIGIEAQRALGAAVRGEVTAVFRNSFYVRFGGDWACFGSSAIGRGPLNVPCSSTPHDWRCAVEVGSPASARPGALTLSGHAIALDDAPIWAPGLQPSSHGANRADGIDALLEWLPARLPAGGMAAFLRRPSLLQTRVETTAWPAVKALSTWAALPMEDNSPPPLPAVCTLLGLGPGLTPSGDDFLAGFTVALRAVGKRTRATALARVISDNEHFTSTLSAAHLRAAIRVGLSEDLDTLLGALLVGRREEMEACIGRLCATPHHSPWDALAGIVTVLRCARRAVCC
jgi:hypothetical protein